MTKDERHPVLGVPVTRTDPSKDLRKSSEGEDESSFKDIPLKSSYSSSQDSLTEDFYVPCLNVSNRYDRAVGYFSSAVFLLIQTTLPNFVMRGGKMRIICSPELSIEDANAIQKGSQDINKVLVESLLEELQVWDQTFDSKAPSSLLRNLVSAGVLSFRLAVPSHGRGIYHPKVGVMHDDKGNSISFNGSANETLRGWSDIGNHEYIDVFRSWEGDEINRVNNHRRVFEEAWQGFVSGIKVYRANDLEQVFKLRENDLPLGECLEIFKAQMSSKKEIQKIIIDKNLNTKTLSPHQEEVIQNWKENDHKGIVSFVTGGGKTLTAIHAAKYWLAKGKPVIILVPSVLLHRQWQMEIQAELPNAKCILIGNESRKSVWKPAVQGVLNKGMEPSPVIFLSTYQTARRPEFLLNIQETKDIFLIADEAHSIGANENQKIMEVIQGPARMALSATYKRFGDEEGTAALEEYFGEVLEPQFDFSDAIQAGRLVPYEYEFITAMLTEDEEEKFEQLTKKMIQSLQWVNGKSQSTPLSQHYARQRANIVKEATRKDESAIKILSAAKPKDRWLVYCNSIDHLNGIRERLNQQGIESLVYHSEMTSDRQSVLNYFEREGGILLSIKCLDEGVDIPKLDRALIIASSSNPREYIQRRGRALRIAPNKYFAYIYDLIVLRSDGQPALITEVTRAETMARNANNLYAQVRLRELIRLWAIKNNDDHSEFNDLEEDLLEEIVQEE